MNIAFDCELPFQLIHFWWPRLKKCLTDHLWLIISMSGNFKMPKILKFVLQWTLLAELAKPALTTYWCSCEILFINKQVRKLYRKFCSNYWSSGTTKEVKLSVLHMNYKKKKKKTRLQMQTENVCKDETESSPVLKHTTTEKNHPNFTTL